jgi:hypothetical protein
MARIFQFGDVFVVEGYEEFGPQPPEYENVYDFARALKELGIPVATPVAVQATTPRFEEIEEPPVRLEESGDAHETALIPWMPPAGPEVDPVPATALRTFDMTFPEAAPVCESTPILEAKEGWWRWRKFSDGVKRAVLRCFCLGDVVADWEHDVRFKRSVATEMRQHVLTLDKETVQRRIELQVEEVAGVEVHHVPRLVANVTVALRMKLGLGAMDRSVPGNVALVRAETAKMLREWNLRKMDAAAHLLLVEKCFFEDDTHYRVTTWRARAAKRSRLVKWLIGGPEQVSFDC